MGLDDTLVLPPLGRFHRRLLRRNAASVRAGVLPRAGGKLLRTSVANVGSGDADTMTLVRHALPIVAPGVCYGALDVPADLAATQQAAKALAQALPHAAVMTASTLQRCDLLAKSIEELRPDLAYKSDARLAEINFGNFEGQRWDSIPRQAYEAWTDDFWQHRFGGVESVADVIARVASAWDEAVVSGQPQVWITHAGVIRAATLLAKGVRRIKQATDWPLAAPAFGQWVMLPVSGAIPTD